MPTISGVVLDSSNNPVKAVVDVLRRSTGARVARGVSSASTGAYSITVPDAGPFTVVRYVAPVIDGDPNWSDVVLDLPMVDDFADSKGHIITVNGGAEIVADSSMFAASCGHFSGSAYLNISNVTELAGYSGPLTIETYFELASQPSGESWNTSFYILSGGGYNADGGLDFAIGNSTIWFSQAAYSSRTLSGAWTYDTNKHHLAVVRVDDAWAMYLDGVGIATRTSSTEIYSGLVDMAVSRAEQTGGASGGYLDGKLQCLRVTKSAKYASGFTPPSDLLPSFDMQGTPTENAQVYDNITAI